MPSQIRGKTERTAQRHRVKSGEARPAGRPPAALDSEFDEMYVNVNMRRMTMQEAADRLGCTVRTLQRRFKTIRQNRSNGHRTQRQTAIRSG